MKSQEELRIETYNELGRALERYLSQRGPFTRIDIFFTIHGQPLQITVASDSTYTESPPESTQQLSLLE